MHNKHPLLIALCLGSGAEQLGNVLEAILLCLFGKGAILLIGLALSGKSFLQVVYSRGHSILLVLSNYYVFICPVSGNTSTTSAKLRLL